APLFKDKDSQILHVIVRPALPLDRVEDRRIGDPIMVEVASRDLPGLLVFLAPRLARLAGDKGVDRGGVLVLYCMGRGDGPRQNKYDGDAKRVLHSVSLYLASLSVTTQASQNRYGNYYSEKEAPEPSVHIKRLNYRYPERWNERRS